MGLATIWAVILPPVKHSLYFHRKDYDPVAQAGEGSSQSLDREGGGKEQSSSLRSKCVWACKFLWRDFVAAYSQWYVVKWSMWWALAMCGYLQGLSYVQLLWDVILKENNEEYDSKLLNGAVEAIYTFIGAAAALGCGLITLDWRRLGELFLGVFSLAIGAVLIGAAMCHAMWIAYTSHILFGVMFNAMITIANAEVAKNIKEDSYGLIFGVNTFLALMVQTVLTVLVAGKGGFELPPREQFVVYGSYFAVMGVVFLLMYIHTLCTKTLKSSSVEEQETNTRC